jgi:hypothetical protein
MGNNTSTVKKIQEIHDHKLFTTQDEFNSLLDKNNEMVYLQCVYHGYSPKIVLDKIDKRYILEISFSFSGYPSIIANTEIFGQYVITITDTKYNLKIQFSKSKWDNINKIESYSDFIKNTMKLFENGEPFNNNLKGIFYQRSFTKKLEEKFTDTKKKNPEMEFYYSK